MKKIFSVGDKKKLRYVVQHEDIATFNGVVVHEVCSTFTLSREIEWATRQFVLEMREIDEEGIGTYLSIEHKSPAFPGEEITIESTIIEINGHELICSYIVRVGKRIIATGKTGQKILKREKIIKLFSNPE